MKRVPNEVRSAAAAIDAVPRAFTVSDVEVRSAPAGSKSPGGVRFYAAMYDTLSQDLGGFREQIKPGTFDTSLASDDIRALFNHDRSLVLGRQAPDKGIATAQITSDERGVLVDIPELPNTSYARDLYESMKRGDIDGASFGFRTVNDEWEVRTVDGVETYVRTLTEARMFDASIVTYPAYLDTVAEARSLCLALAQQRAGRVLSDKSMTHVQAAIDALTELITYATDGNGGQANNEENSLRAAATDDDGPDGEDAELALLNAMFALGTEYINVEDDASDIDAMTQILDQLQALIDAEDVEDAPEDAVEGQGARALALAKLKLRFYELSDTSHNNERK